MRADYEMTDGVSFASDFKNLNIVESLIDKICKEHKIQEDFYGNILIGVTEAVTNAIQHGNLNDVSKKVTVSYLINDKKLTFVIRDEGKGFSFADLPDPTSPENIEKESGRGIFLIKSLADEVSFENNGNKVIVSFFI